MTDSWDEVLDWERWAKEVLTDWRVPFDNHKVGLRLGITQQLCDLRDERDAIAARLADVSGMLVEAWTLMVDGKVADDFGDRLQQWIDTRQPSEKRVTTRATDSASGGAE